MRFLALALLAACGSVDSQPDGPSQPDGGACVPECPTEAIFSEDDLPDKWAEYKELNASLAEKWPVIDKKKDSLPDAEEWKGVEAKRQHLSEQPFAG